MLPRFLVLANGTDVFLSLEPDIAARLRSIDPGMQIHAWGSTIVAVAGSPVIPLEQGVVIGALVDRRYPLTLSSLPEGEKQVIRQSRGQHLISSYWGGYVAIIGSADGMSVDIVRAPFGELPCYHKRYGQATLLASDMDMLILAGIARPPIAWSGVARELAWQDIRTDETCLEGISALQMGHRLTIGKGLERVEQLWSPWDHVKDRHGSAAEESERIRQSTGHCISARASYYDRVLLMLSGGIDSSIVAAGLQASGNGYSLATLMTRDRHGDERDFGRLMAKAGSQPLHEALRDVRRIDPDHTDAARLPRPTKRMFEQESARIAIEQAHSVGAQAIFSGGGGDNVYCGLHSAAPVADRLLTGGAGREMFHAARHISEMAGVSIQAVVRSALRLSLPWNRTGAFKPDLSYLSRNAAALASATPVHPWFARPRQGLPGKMRHIKLLAYAQSYVDGLDPQMPMPMIAPLLGQPLVEACLSIPTWRWFEDGKNRMVARRAFARELPPQITERRSKGTTDSFTGEIFELHHARLQEILMDGLLAAQGILDRNAIERSFRSTGAVAPPDTGRLLRLVDVETWTRTWHGGGASRTATNG
jgi:asparagine synthase (glutamine-hydrolysing)